MYFLLLKCYRSVCFSTGRGEQSSLDRWKMYGECCCTDGQGQRTSFISPIFHQVMSSRAKRADTPRTSQQLHYREEKPASVDDLICFEKSVGLKCKLLH